MVSEPIRRDTRDCGEQSRSSKTGLGYLHYCAPHPEQAQVGREICILHSSTEVLGKNQASGNHLTTSAEAAVIIVGDQSLCKISEQVMNQFVRIRDVR